MRATVKDVAAKANVSISTVSRVLTGSAPVSDHLHARVVRAIEELGYRPNALARGLRMRRTATLGLIVPDIANPFFGQLAKTVEERASSRGFGLLLCNSQNSRQRELHYLELLRSQQVDGLIVVTSGAVAEPLHEFVRATSAATLALDRRIRDFSGPLVAADPHPGSREAVAHLLQLGHRRIGVVRGVPGDASSDERYDAIRRALAERGLEDGLWVWSGEYTLETGVAAGHHWFDTPKDRRPTAIIAASEFSAYGFIDAVSRHGLRVPEDLSVVGFDNTAFAPLFRPALTVIAQPIADLGAAAVDTILRMIAHREGDARRAVAPVPGSESAIGKKESVDDVVLPTYLVRRASTGSVPRAD